MIDIPDSIFPKDPEGNLLCPRCRKPVKNCNCPSFDKPARKTAPALKPVVRLDKSGRKGKTVTMITSLPRNEKFLKDLAKTIKTKTGSGGTTYLGEQGGVIEIQGDHKSAIEQFFLDQKLVY